MMVPSLHGCRSRVFLTLLGIGLLLPSGAAHAKPKESNAAPAPISVRIVTDKTEYKKGERIQVSFELTNLGDSPIYVNKRLYVNPDTLPADDREVLLKLMLPSGSAAPYKFSYAIGLPQSDDFELLPPNQSVKGARQWDLSSFFDLNETGAYTLGGTYQNVFGKELGLDVFKGPVEIEPLTLTVTP